MGDHKNATLTEELAECRLCGRRAALHESHVIPKSFFRSIKRSGPALLAHDDVWVRNRRTQESWSQRLFCSECEGRISRWEGYVVDILRNPARQKAVVRKAPHQWEFFNVQYAPFRLFQVSLLFRAAISSHIAYEHVRLERAVVGRMQYLLNSGQPPPPDELPCLMEVILSPSKPGALFKEVIGAPRTLTIGKQLYYWFVFGGFCWYFVFPRLNEAEKHYESYLGSGGYMRLPALEVREHPWLSLAVVKTALKEESGWTK